MEQSLSIVCSFRVANYRGVDIVAELDLEPAGLIVANHKPFRSFTDHPLGEFLHDRVEVIGDYVFRRVNELSFSQPLGQKIEYFIGGSSGLAFKLDDVENGEAEFFEIRIFCG